MFESIVEALAYHAKSCPHKICVVDEEREYTYADMWRLTIGVSENLKKYNVPHDGYVVVECTQDARYLVCSFACQLIGAQFVPVESKVSLDRLGEILKEVKASLYIAHNVVDSLCKTVDIDSFFDEACVISSTIELDRTFSVCKEARCEVLYTTGTTGKQKGVVLTNGNNIAVAENIKYGTCMSQDSVELIPLPLSHSHGLRTCYANILNGSTVILVNGIMNVKKIFLYIEDYKVTALDLSPSAAKILLKLSKGYFEKYASQIDFIQIGTAVLDEALKEELCKIFYNSRLYNFYGSTESGRVCVYDFNKEKGKTGCIGKPAHNATCKIVDENRNEIDSSRENLGLLAIAGKMNMKGYLGEAEGTKAVMCDGYIYTNDIGFIDENGDVYVLGRNDDVINYKGIKIIPEEIEEYALKYDGVLDCACVSVEDEICGNIPRLFVETNREGFDTDKLLKFLAQYMEANKMPKEIRLIDKIPRTTNGKISRKDLRSL